MELLSDPLGDPFLDVLRRRHPDVDVVVLPPEGPSETPDPVPDETVAAAVARVAAAARTLWAAIGSDAPDLRVAYGAGPGAVRALARLSSRRDDGVRLLVALEDLLEREGWETARPVGGVERLLGHLDDLTLSASYAVGSGALLVELSSASLPVGRTRARALVAAGAGGR